MTHQPILDWCNEQREKLENLRDEYRRRYEFETARLRDGSALMSDLTLGEHVARQKAYQEITTRLLEDDGLYDECVQVAAMAMRLAEEGDKDFPETLTTSFDPPRDQAPHQAQGAVARGGSETSTQGGDADDPTPQGNPTQTSASKPDPAPAVGESAEWPGEGSARCCCCRGENPPRDPDPWQGRLDAYCEDCAEARCDAYPGECPNAPHATPTQPEQEERWTIWRSRSLEARGIEGPDTDGWIEVVPATKADSLQAELDQAREALKAIRAYIRRSSPDEHRNMGRDCGEGPCLLCLVEATAQQALDPTPSDPEEGDR